MSTTFDTDIDQEPAVVPAEVFVLTRGRGELVASATGAAAEMGRLIGMLASVDADETPRHRTRTSS